MKFNTVAFAFVGLAAAQLEGLPTCAQGCVTQFTTGSNIGGCPQLDVKCICSSEDFLSGIACCLASACSAADQKTAVQFAASLCQTQGVTVPSSVSCSTTAMTSMSMTGSMTMTGNATTTATQTSRPASTTPAAASQNVAPKPGAGSGVTGLFGAIIAALAFF